MKKLIIISLFSIAIVFSNSNQTFAAKEENCTINAKVNGLVCDFCARAVEKVFGKREEVKDIKVDMDKSFVHIVMNEDKNIDDKEVEKLITDSGYNLAKLERKQCPKVE